MLLKTKIAAEMDIRLEAVGNRGEIKPLRHVVLTKEPTEVEDEDANVILVMYAESVVEVAAESVVAPSTPRIEAAELPNKSEDEDTGLESNEALARSNELNELHNVESEADMEAEEVPKSIAFIKPTPTSG